MVKLGSNLVDKSSGKGVSEDGFNTIPLITPLDPGQLQLPLGDKLVVKLPEYDLEKQKRPCSPSSAEVSISVIKVFERLTGTLLVICALAFLVCVVFLVVYEVYQYVQPCPKNFVYTQGRCMPEELYVTQKPLSNLIDDYRLYGCG